MTLEQFPEPKEVPDAAPVLEGAETHRTIGDIVRAAQELDNADMESGAETVEQPPAVERHIPTTLEEAIAHIINLENVIDTMAETFENRLAGHTKMLTDLFEKQMTVIGKLYSSDEYFGRVTTEVLKRLEAIDSLAEGRMQADISDTPVSEHSVQLMVDTLSDPTTRTVRVYRPDPTTKQPVEVDLPADLSPVVLKAVEGHPTPLVENQYYWITFRSAAPADTTAETTPAN